jgi:hypothetical protein
MKVYAIRGRGWYGGGIAIVAAVDEETALRVAGTIIDPNWRTDYANGDVTELELTADRGGVVDHFEMGE